MTLKRRNNGNKVVLGLSGGVDSTAAALLLQEKGFEVTGLFFDIHKKASEKTEADDNIERKKAELAAEQLGIELICKNVGEIFEEKVISDFCRQYLKGNTPNPCIVCNPEVKFRTLAEEADKIGAEYIATGHYAGICRDEESGKWYISRSKNEKKDQSYMLYRLGQDIISRLLLPLEGITDKEQVRDMARKKVLNNSEAKDSQEICFIEDGENYRDFIRSRGAVCEKGCFTDKNGNVLGQHSGILNYTIGQRKGLGVALGKPAFVIDIDSENNRVVLGDNEDLFSREVLSCDNLIEGAAPDIGFTFPENVEVKIRYGAKPAKASAEVMKDGRIMTVFEEPQRAATPGQSIVFYHEWRVIGGGFISR